MTHTNRMRMAAALAALALVIGLAGFAQAAEHEAGMTMVKKATCTLAPTEGSEAKGTVTFTQTDDGVLIEATVEGLTPNQEHGFHVHQFGDVSKSDGTGTGGHFNPHGKDHASPTDEMRHVGDLGNLKADDKGVATYSRVDKEVSLDLANASCVVGRGIIVHAGMDDLKSQPTGAAGARIAQGVIGVANAE